MASTNHGQRVVLLRPLRCDTQQWCTAAMVHAFGNAYRQLSPIFKRECPLRSGKALLTHALINSSAPWPAVCGRSLHSPYSKQTALRWLPTSVASRLRDTPKPDRSSSTMVHSQAVSRKRERETDDVATNSEHLALELLSFINEAWTPFHAVGAQAETVCHTDPF